MHCKLTLHYAKEQSRSKITSTVSLISSSLYFSLPYTNATMGHHNLSPPHLLPPNVPITCLPPLYVWSGPTRACSLQYNGKTPYRKPVSQAGLRSQWCTEQFFFGRETGPNLRLGIKSITSEDKLI